MLRPITFFLLFLGSFPLRSQQIFINPFSSFDSGFKEVNYIAFSNDDHMLASDKKGAFKVWDLNKGNVIAEKAFRKPIFFASFTENNSKIILVLSSGKVELLSRDLFQSFIQKETADIPIKVTLDPNKHYLTILEKSGFIEIYDLKANMLSGRIDARNEFRDVKFIGYDRFGQKLAGVSHLGNVLNWNPYNQQLIRKLSLSSAEYHNSKSLILSVASNQASDLYAVGMQEVYISKGGLQGNHQQPERKNMLLAYNWHDGRELKRIKINERPDQIALGPGPNHIIYLTKDKAQVSVVSIDKSEIDSRVALEELPRYLALAENNVWMGVALKGGTIAVYTFERNQTAEIKITKPSLSRNYITDEISTDNINITGSIVNHRKINNVQINGRKVAFDVTGNFGANVQLRPGKNKISIIATNSEEKQFLKEVYVNRVAGNNLENYNEKKLIALPKLNKVALVIGNSNYQHTAVLKNPKNDALSMSNILRKLGFQVIEVEDGSYEKMKEAVYRFGTQISNSDVSIFYFAGHGIEIDGSNYLIPTDAQLSSALDVKLRSIPLKSILSIMEYANDEGLNMVILDACRNNPFPTGKRGGAGLSKVASPSGTLIAYATDPGSTASDGVGLNGLYTGELIKQMKISQRIVDVFRETRVSVEEISKGKQRPWEEARLKGVFYLK